MDLAAKRTELKTLLDGISGLQVYAAAPAKIMVPCAVIAPSSIRPHAAMGPGIAEVNFNVQVLVQLADWESMQKELDGFISTGTANSVVDALETTQAEVNLIDSYGTTTFDDGVTRYGTVTLHVTMIADG